ncbi:Gfo/Idh/MocA family protein [Actinomadura madurae]|uniref:Gfo/Idh/MocA family protein n=1 Tax=Actinomadura madurae TaxID=1993 RepID=UPI0020D23D91|nr:Gfo/Idh/MocA family oxidoreductase [Actinomadura madurae]MCQ0014289.1 Gfo/Idh/MocA family oxidoreductase [Actinomadura madurae]
MVVAGVNGYGRHHLENVRRLAAAGRAELTGVCDLRPPAGLGVPVSADLPALIRETGAEVAVIATPIHTHAPLAVAALRAGAHVLLEKPPAPSAAEFEEISAAVAETGLACQVGFQSLGSEAVRAARDVLGEPVRGIGVAGAWTRPFGYYTRSAWAGRRRLDGVDVMDGALTNPFAHAVASALAVAGADTMDSVAGIELELHRANAIESDDTSSARIRLAAARSSPSPSRCARTGAPSPTSTSTARPGRPGSSTPSTRSRWTAPGPASAGPTCSKTSSRTSARAPASWCRSRARAASPGCSTRSGSPPTRGRSRGGSSGPSPRGWSCPASRTWRSARRGSWRPSANWASPAASGRCPSRGPRRC